MSSNTIRLAAVFFVALLCGAAIFAAPYFQSGSVSDPQHMMSANIHQLPERMDPRHLARSIAYSPAGELDTSRNNNDGLFNFIAQSQGDRLPARSQREADSENDELPAASQKQGRDGENIGEQTIYQTETEIDDQLRAAASFYNYQQPYLKIWTRRHNAPIRSMSVDAAEKYMVTGSWDKTAIVWRIPQKPGEKFELSQIIRVPIQEGDGGKIYAVAISPDGSRIAVGGRAANDMGRRDLSVYIFDRVSGKLVHRIGGLPNVTLALEFSPAGDLLVAGFADNEEGTGAIAWRTDGWSEFQTFGRWIENPSEEPCDETQTEAVSPDAAVGDTPMVVSRCVEHGNYEFNKDVHGLDMNDQGLLAITSKDGSLRIYKRDDNGFGQHAIAIPFSSRPCLTCQVEREIRPLLDVAFSPDGAKIAVGAYDAPYASILDADSLAELAQLDMSGIDRRDNLSIFAWSGDGVRLFAGGRAHQSRSDFFIRVFDAANGNIVRDIVAANNSIEGIEVLEDGRILFAAADPRIGIFDGHFELISALDPLVGDLRLTPNERLNRSEGLKLSEDGREVIWRPDASDPERHFQFSIARRSLELAVDERDDFFSVTTSTPNIQMDRWIDDYRPTLNGETLKIFSFEQSRTVAIPPISEDAVVVGSDFRLRKFDASGNLLWQRAAPGTVWQINYTRDERHIVAAYSDGTIRWHDDATGKERLALFVTNDWTNPEWIAWTPAGYYDASPGGQNLIGWHVNQDREREALYFSASRFHNLYYRPDIIKTALDGDDPTAPPSREELLAAAPPIVTILGERVQPNGDIAIDYEATTIFGEPVEIDLFVDNAKLDNEGGRNQALVGERQSITVPRGACASSIAVIARTEDGRASDAALVSRASLSRVTCSADGAPPKPDLHALFIGVSDYENDSLDLDFADRDAADFAALLESQAGRAYENVSITTVVNENATNDGIRAALAELEVAADENDVSLLFFAGHGVKSDRLNSFFFLAYDSDTSTLRTTAVESDIIKRTVQNMLGRKFVFLDACFSEFASNDGLSLFDTHGISNILGGSDIRAEVFASSTGDQLSFENEDWENGAFTEAILEGLAGDADLIVDDEITNTELDLWVKTRVAALTDSRQTPSHTGAGSTQVKFIEVP